MVYIPGNIPQKEEVLKTVRAAMAKHGGRITRSRFLAESGMKGCDVLRYHAGWNALLREAGCTREASNSKVDPERLLADWGGVINSGEAKRGPLRLADLYKIAAKSATNAFWVFLTFYVICAVVAWFEFLRMQPVRAVTGEHVGRAPAPVGAG